jgi:hypothetical protein
MIVTGGLLLLLALVIVGTVIGQGTVGSGP